MAKFTSRLRAAAAAVPSLACDAGGLSGAALVSYGAWLMYPPAGFIVGGVLLTVASVLIGVRLNAGAS